MSATADLRQPILPFRYRPYIIMLALSVALFIVIPLLACIVCGLLWGLGCLAKLLSWSLGIIVSSVVVGLAAQNNKLFDSEERNTALGLAWLCGTCLISYFTYNPLVYASETLLNLAPILWNYFMLIYENSGIVYWSWIPISLMILYGSVSLLSLWTMKLLDWRPHFGLIRFICPHEDCGRVSSSLIYKCPHCGNNLDNLRPSRYGIFYAPCRFCGKSLNASWLTGRNKYSKTCPDCNNMLNYDDFGNIPESVFVVEGAPKSGKTSFLFQAMNQWASKFSEHVYFSDSNQEETVCNMAKELKKGNFCPSTPYRSCPEAYLMHCKKMFHSFLAYFYDVGSSSSNVDSLIPEPYYKLINGIFLVIDPWAERSVLEQIKGKGVTLPSTYQYASQDANAVISRVCSKLECIYTETIDTGYDIPICVVVTKCDLNGLNKTIGGNEQLLQSSKKWAQQSKQVEEFLIDNGMYNFVTIIKTRFKKNAFFAVSVLDDAAYDSGSLLTPLLWMTCNVNV